jgi:Uma2 family endonuclease
VAFVSAERWSLDREIPEEGDWEIVPDLAVEVISPNELFEDVHDKIGKYFSYGVRQVWVVLPRQRQIHVYDSRLSVRILGDGDELNAAPLLEFRLSVGPLFHRNPAGAPQDGNGASAGSP